MQRADTRALVYHTDAALFTPNFHDSHLDLWSHDSCTQMFSTSSSNLISSSAYCGGMWLASLVVMCKMARLLENDAKHQYYRGILDRGSAAFDKLLWNGKITTLSELLQLFQFKMSRRIFTIRQVLQL